MRLVEHMKPPFSIRIVPTRVVVLATIGTLAMAAAAQEPLAIPRIQSPIIIDGDIDEPGGRPSSRCHA